jgi:hypothetical protein
MLRHVSLSRVAPLIPLLLAACVTEGEEYYGPQSEFLQPSMLMKEQIARRIADLPYLGGSELIDALYWLGQRGETAYEPLIEQLESPTPKMRALALNILCLNKDRRVLPYIEPLANDPDQSVRYEAARGMARLGDLSHVEILVAGLEDDSRYVRALCARFLKEQTRDDFGYEPDAPPPERSVAVARWRDWAQSLPRD